MSNNQVLDTDQPVHSCRFSRTVKVALASLAALVGVTLMPASANAATAVSSTGYVGGVREAATPAICNNSAYGYDVTAYGPTVSGVRMPNGETTQYVRWEASLYDATTGKYVANPGFSNWTLVSTTSALQFNNALLTNGIRGHVLQVENLIEWWSPSTGGITGLIDYKDSTYYISDQRRYATSC